MAYTINNKNDLKGIGIIFLFFFIAMGLLIFLRLFFIGLISTESMIYCALGSILFRLYLKYFI